MQTNLILLALAAMATLAQSRPMGYEPSPMDPLLPKGFEILPAEAIDRLRTYHFDHRLTPDARRDRIESIFDNLPSSILERLPLAPGLARLPEPFQAPFHALQVDRTISWRERMAKTRAIIALLPIQLQQIVEPRQQQQQQASISMPTAASALPSRPPAGFETALSPTLYAQLLHVHTDASLSDAEKKMRLNAIMRMAPREQLDRLPLPAGFENLPIESLSRARTILHDFSLEWDQRALALERFIATLPQQEQQALLAGASTIQQKPELSQQQAYISQLPQPQQGAIVQTLGDRSLGAIEKFAKVERILESLPSEVRARVPPPPPKFPFWAPRIV